jgi:hypothetical protein
LRKGKIRTNIEILTPKSQISTPIYTHLFRGGIGHVPNEGKLLSLVLINKMITSHKIEELTFENNMMRLKVDGKTVSIPLDKVSNKLSTANEIQRGLYKISPAGYGIHWPLLDEDLSIASLMEFAR